MEEQTELNKPIGTLELEKKEILQPKKVKIVQVGTREPRPGKIIECAVKHPDKEELIHISSVAYLRDKQVVSSGLWMALDKDDNIQKGSALATFMSKLGVQTPKELEGKEVETELDDKQWLCFKCY